MDGSRYVPGAESASHATRLALTVDRDAVGLMKHASQLGHLVEWWLQSTAANMPPLAALRLGRKLERFRLAARLAEGKSSRQVQTALDTLRQEFALHEPPKEILAELDSAARESTRLAAASKPPPTVFQEAFRAETEMPVEPAAPPPRKSTSKALLLLLLLVVSGAAVVYLRPGLVGAVVGAVMARLPLT
ncbi:MAG: hypothetical protein U5L03_16135 [Burkholderiaceae bacterium]|nr:hypothetical protein [Burkholderiaceae bacterium]